MPDPVSDSHSALALALSYAAAGLRVLPIKPGTKRPPMTQWVEAATTDPAIIKNWYEALYRDHGVGLAMGHQPDGRFVFALDVDEHDVAHSGVETLSDLQAEHGTLPDTVCSITGSGGLHLLFTHPAGVDVRNGIAGDGLDVRGEGGQIVVAPSVHPVTGRRYEWEDTFAPWERAIVEAPVWLIDLVKVMPVSAAPPSQSAPAPTFNTPDSPAEWLRAQWDWPLQLRDAGWVEHHVNRQTGDIHWTRPGEDKREGESAVLHMPDGPLVVFSTDASMTGLRSVVRHANRDGSLSVSPIQFYAAQRHGGDLSAAARAIGKLMDPADRRLTVVTPTIDDPQNPLARYMAQRLDWPTFWKDDHTGEQWFAEPLIPAGRLVALYAPAKQGKSEIALAVVAAVAAGRTILGQPNPYGPRDVVYFDYEMTTADLWARLDQLGYDETVDFSHLHYWPLPSLPPLDTAEGSAVARAIAAECHAEAVVIDTLGRAVEGDENSNDTYRAFARHTGLGLKSDGVAVLRTDHAGKDREKGQRGASAKNDDADVVFRVDRIDSGWRLTRTHTRIGWVPETVLVDRTELSDKRLLVELASGSKPTYPTGTGGYAAELKAAGVVIDLTTTRRQLQKMTQALDPPLSRGNDKMDAVLRFVKSTLNTPTQVSPGGSPAPLAHPEPDRPLDGHTEDVDPADRRLSAPTLGDIR